MNALPIFNVCFSNVFTVLIENYSHGIPPKKDEGPSDQDLDSDDYPNNYDAVEFFDMTQSLKISEE